jgi:hypothetical protein
MPQETKSMPFDPEQQEVSPGFEHENLHGWIPSLASDDEIRTALEKAFDYRGDVTITLKDGTRLEGYVFDKSFETWVKKYREKKAAGEKNIRIEPEKLD